MLRAWEVFDIRFGTFPSGPLSQSSGAIYPATEKRALCLDPVSETWYNTATNQQEVLLFMLQQLTERVWYLPHDEPSDRPVLTYIEGDQLSVAVDAGASPAHVREFYTAITDQRLSIPEITILTHWHWDHSFGLCAVNGFTLASKKTDARLREMARWAWTPEAMAARLASGEEIPFCHEHICLEYRRPEWIQVIPADMTLEGEGTMDIGGVTIRCETCDSPHSRDALLISADGCLIIGDAGYEDFYELDRQYDKGRLAAFLEKLKGRDETWLVAGHEEPLPLKDFIAYLEGIYHEL